MPDMRCADYEMCRIAGVRQNNNTVWTSTDKFHKIIIVYKAAKRTSKLLLFFKCFGFSKIKESGFDSTQSRQIIKKYFFFLKCTLW